MKLDDIREIVQHLDCTAKSYLSKPAFALVQYKPTSRTRYYKVEEDIQIALQTPQWCVIDYAYPDDKTGLIAVSIGPVNNGRLTIPYAREILAIMTYEEACETHPELVI